MAGRTPKSTDTTHGAILQGKRVLVTRSRAQARGLIRRLQALGAVPIAFPTIRMVPPADHYTALDAALRQLATFDWVVFTSVNGVVHVWRRLAAVGLAAHAFAAMRLAAVGPATARALTARGLRVAVLPDRYVAEALLDTMPHPAGQRFLLPCAAGARDALRAGLEAAGAKVVAAHAYRTVVAKPRSNALAALALGVDILTFTSGSTVRNFITQVGAERVEALATQACVVAIGPITADTARELGLRVDIVATEHTMAGLVAALVAAFSSSGTTSPRKQTRTE